MTLKGSCWCEDYVMSNGYPHRPECTASPRQNDIERVSALAGVTPDGAILPPRGKIVIDRTPVTWWKRGR